MSALRGKADVGLSTLIRVLGEWSGSPIKRLVQLRGD